MKVSTKAVLFVVVVFLVGAIGGVVSSRIVLKNIGPSFERRADVSESFGNPPFVDSSSKSLRGRPQKFDKRRPLPGQFHPGRRPGKAILGRMIRELDLDKDKAAQVREVLEKSHRLQIEATNQHREQMLQVRKQTLKEIQNLLKPGQAKLLQRMLRRFFDENENRRRDPRNF